MRSCSIQHLFGFIFLTAAVTSGWTKAQESQALDAARAGQESNPVKMALPESTDLPFDDHGGDFFSGLTAEQERNIVDRAYPLMAAKWPFNTIFVCWEDMAMSQSADRLLVQEAVRDTWQAVSGLKFLGWGQCAEQTRGIRIAVRDEGPYVQFLGKYVDGVPDGMVLNFAYENWGIGCKEKREYCNRTIAVHEFGHAIGFAHEQNRPDTPGECDMAQGTDGDTTTLTPWDPHSVMNYCNEVYSNDGVLSPFDILAVRYIYGDAS